MRKISHYSAHCRRVAVPLWILLLAITFGRAAQIPTAVPAQVGMSAERMERLHRSMQEYIDKGRLVGLVTLVLRDGKIVDQRAYGKLDPVQGTPMPLNAIFRIASQSKAVTTTAVMMLQEEGKLLIDDPISKYIPEFAASRVAVPAVEKDAKGYATVPLKRAITIRDLLTHTAGISYGTGTAKEAYTAAGISGWFLADKTVPIGEIVKKLAGLPFDSHPGEKYLYGYNTDILGYLVEVASGMSLAEYIARNIAGPLGMADTHFFLPESKLDRFTPVYGIGENGALKLIEPARSNAYVQGPRICYAGGAGLLASAEDYARFLLMLMNGGELHGVRLLSPKTVELMTADHVGALYGLQGFGLGFWVTDRLGRNGQPGTKGSFGWGGAYHTTYWVDPVEKLVCVLMTQLMPATNSDLHTRFRAMVYQTIVESYEKK